MEKQKRERSTNFTQEETNLLVSLIEAQIHIIENKKSEAAIWQQKEKAWKEIEKDFNNISRTIYRNHKHLRLKYEAIKRDIRKKCAVLAESYITCDGISTTPMLSPAEEKVKSLMMLSLEGHESQFDSDLVMPIADMCENVIEYVDPEPISVKKEQCEFQNETPQGVFQENDIDITETKVREWKPNTPKSQKHPVLSKQKGKRPFDTLTEERIEIAKIKKKILIEEFEQKLLQRKLLEKELEQKEIVFELEKEHIYLKNVLLKKQLGEL